MPLQKRGIVLDLDLTRSNVVMEYDDDDMDHSSDFFFHEDEPTDKRNLYYQKQTVSSILWRAIS